MIRRAVAGLLFALVSAVSTPAHSAPAQSAPVQPVPTALAQGTAVDSVLESRTTALSKHLRCVVCQGLSIEDSPSELARQMRDIVKEQLRSGKSEDEVRAYFISKYGEWILLEPKASGFNLLVYALPALALLAGAGLIVRSVRRWTAPSPTADPE